MRKPTIRQKLAFNKILEKIQKKEKFNLGQIMVDSGYTKSTAVCPDKNLLSKEGFLRLLSQIDDRVILARFFQILVDDDKRASLEAGKEILKLKDRYPEQKTKVMGLFGSLKKKG